MRRRTAGLGAFIAAIALAGCGGSYESNNPNAGAIAAAETKDQVIEAARAHMVATSAGAYVATKDLAGAYWDTGDVVLPAGGESCSVLSIEVAVEEQPGLLSVTSAEYQKRMAGSLVLNAQRTVAAFISSTEDDSTTCLKAADAGLRSFVI
jgi:hypothetical protein